MPEPTIVRLAEVEKVIDLRWRILRAGLPRETACFEGDLEPTTRHLIAEQAGRVIGCVSILHRDWQGLPAWQMRGMAVDEALQRSGIGRQLLAEVERVVRSETYGPQLWCNARSPAVPFYQKLGWELFGAEFVIPTAGPHYKMTKLLK